MFWKIILVLGILGCLLGAVVAGGFVAAPGMTSGRVSWDEAAIGIVIGAVVLIVSFFMFLIGLIFIIMNRRKKAQVPV